jgi:hypothetical protein
MLIKNIPGTSDRKCKCSSWLNHWLKFSRQRTDYCQVIGCFNTPIGAHVRYADGPDNKEYIFPLCDEHNKTDEILNVSDIYQMISANQSETCDK